MVDCSGLENLAGKAPETAETVDLCGSQPAQDAPFTSRSAGRDGAEVGTGLEPCPFCGTAMLRHDHCFSHPKPVDGDCILRHYSFDKQKAGDWNRRFFAGDETERARVVEWLDDKQADWWRREQGYRAAGNNGPYIGGPSYGWAARRIESGDHLASSKELPE